MTDTEMKGKIKFRGMFRAACGFFVALVFITPALAQRRERLIDTWKPLHYDVAITLNDQLTEIAKARTEITAEILKDNVGLIDLDFGSLAIDSVTIADHPAYFEWTPQERLTVSLARITHAGEKLSIVVNYHGRPRDGLILASDRDNKPSATGRAVTRSGCRQRQVTNDDQKRRRLNRLAIRGDQTNPTVLHGNRC